MKNKIKLTIILILMCIMANAFNVTIQNSTNINDPYFAPLLIFHGFITEKGLGSVSYITNNKPNTYHQLPKSTFNAFMTYHTSSIDFGNALISTHDLIVGNIKFVGGKRTNFVVALRQKDGRLRIGPMPCVIDSKKQCYEIPHAIIRVKINNKFYNELVDVGEVVLPKGDLYEVRLNITENIEQIEIGKIKPINESTTNTKRKLHIKTEQNNEYDEKF